MHKTIVEDVPGFYRIIALTPFRKTAGVSFEILPMEYLQGINGIDRVIHTGGAVSPGPVAGVDRPWYMHPNQEDNLIVLHGKRTVDIYTARAGRVETFVVESDRVLRDGKAVCDGPAMLVWPRNVFHRITSGESGSASLNFAVRDPGYDVKTNFNIYDLDTVHGTFSLARAGHLDQSPG